MNTLFLKKIDQIIGGLAADMLPAPPARHLVESPKQILFIRPGGIGDAVLLVPVLRSIRSAYECRVDILAESRNCGIFELCPVVRAVYRYDKPAEFFTCIKKRYDLIIDTEQWHRLSAVIARMIRSRLKIGFATNNRKRLFSHTVPYSHEEYETFSFFRLLSPLGLPVPDRIDTPFLTLPDSANTKAEALLAPIGTERFVAVFPGASIPERRWGYKNFSTVSKKLNRLNLPVVIIGGREDREAGEKILQNTHGTNLAGKTSLAESAAVLARALLLISGDSGVLHMAAGLDIPTVSLFGPGISEKWAPRGRKHMAINHHLECSPCTRFGYTSPCHRHARCIQDITPNEVMDAVLSLIMLQDT